MRWFLTGYGTPVYPTAPRRAIGAKLIGPHGGLQIGRYSRNQLHGMTQ